MTAAPRRILVVGDPVFARSLVRLVLDRLDYAVDCVDSAHEAEALAARRRIALFLVALSLPDASGLELAARLRRRCGPAVPILLFGDAWNAERVTVRCRELGLAGYLAKPVSIGRLIATIRDLLRGPPLAGEEAGGGDEASQVRTRLAEVTGGDPELARELLELFLATARRYLGELHRAAEETQFRRVAHALAGAARNVGAAEMAGLARRLEREGPSAVPLERLRERLESLARDLAGETTCGPSIPARAEGSGR